MTLTALMANLGCNLMLCHIDDEWCARKPITENARFRFDQSLPSWSTPWGRRPRPSRRPSPTASRPLSPASRLEILFCSCQSLYLLYISLSNYLSFFRDLTFCFCTVAFYLGHYLVYHKVSFLILFIASLSWKPFYDLENLSIFIA